MVIINRQTLFKVSVKDIQELRIYMVGDWFRDIKRQWGGKREEKRYIFKIKDMDYNFFECNNKMAKNILNKIDDFSKKECLIRLKQNEKLSFWGRLKNFWRRDK